jgi:hypothetical protein
MSLRGHNRSNTSNPTHAHQRASSVPSSRSPCPPLPVASLTTAALAEPKPPSPDDPDDDEKSRSATANSASLLQPRVAVALNVPQPWHPWLFALRLASILPAVFWGTPVALRLLLLALELVLGPPNMAGVAYGGDGDEGGEVLLPVTEMALASIWCFACGYLSFFFTDCLMSRWYVSVPAYLPLLYCCVSYIATSPTGSLFGSWGGANRGIYKLQMGCSVSVLWS